MRYCPSSVYVVQNVKVLITTKRGEEGTAQNRCQHIVLRSDSTYELAETARQYQYATYHNMMKKNDGAEPLFLSRFSKNSSVVTILFVSRNVR